MNTKPFSPLIISPPRFADDRGWFMETYSTTVAANHGITDTFVQDNHSKSIFSGTIRGIHFQRPPHVQAKMVRCVRGSIIDYAVDLRKGSPTYGEWTSAELTDLNGQQLYVPEGYGHAFVTLEPETEVVYKVSDDYARDCDGGIAWNDPSIAISWPLRGRDPVLSDKDRKLPMLADFDSPFPYDGRPMVKLKT